MKNNKEQSWSQRQSSIKWILLFFSSFSYLPTPPVPPAIKLLCVCWFSGGVSSRRYQNQKMGCQKKGGGGVGVETNDTRRELWIEFDWSEVEFQTPTPFPPPPSPTCQSPVWLVYHTVHSPEWKGHSQPEYK
jgi:hypothetical protein